MRWDGDSWRRWSGRRWARPVYSLQPRVLVRRDGPATWARLDQDRLDHGIRLAVEDQVTRNAARVDHEGPHGVLLAYKVRVSHGLHLVLTILTGGLWGFVWIGVALSSGYDRVRLETDPYGHVWAVPLSPR